MPAPWLPDMKYKVGSKRWGLCAEPKGSRFLVADSIGKVELMLTMF